MLHLVSWSTTNLSNLWMNYLLQFCDFFWRKSHPTLTVSKTNAQFGCSHNVNPNNFPNMTNILHMSSYSVSSRGFRWVGSNQHVVIHVFLLESTLPIISSPSMNNRVWKYYSPEVFPLRMSVLQKTMFCNARCTA